MEFSYKPICTYKTLKTIAGLMLSVSLLTSCYCYVMMFYYQTPKDELAGFLDFFMQLGKIAIPLIVYSLFLQLNTEKEKTVRVVLLQLAMAILFYAFEIILYYYFIVPFLSEMIGSEIGIDVTLIIKEISNLFLGLMGNVNVFIDTFALSLIFLFLIYTPKKIKEKNIKFYRLLTLVPVTFIIASNVIMYFIKTGAILSNVYISGVFSARPIYVYFFFFALCFYTKYRHKIYGIKHDLEQYNSYIESNVGLRRYTYVISIFLILISLAEFGFSFVPDHKYYNVGTCYYLFLLVPFILLCNPLQIPKHLWTQVFNILLLAIVGIVIGLAYFALFAYYADMIFNI